MHTRRRLRQRTTPISDSLEQRLLLTTIVVNNLTDTANAPDTSSIANLVANDGGDGISLREAIAATNSEAGADIIDFDESLAWQEITLGGTELEITDSLSVGSEESAFVIIDAADGSRVINFSATAGDLSLFNLGIANGNVDADGAGIRFNSSGTLTAVSTGIYNHTAGTLTSARNGAGIFSLGTLVLTDSFVATSYTYFDGVGGGIYAGGDLTLTNSRVLSNGAHEGAGIYATSGTHIVKNSTIAGNRVQSAGGGIFSTESSVLTVRNSTVTANYGVGTTEAGGLFALADLTVENSIVAGNEATIGADLTFDPTAAISFRFNLIGSNANTGLSESHSADSDGNLIGGPIGGIIDPLFAPESSPVVDDVYRLLATSPAIDAGDPSFSDPTIPNDQRGDGFPRIVGDRVDIGASEGAFSGLIFNTTDGTLFIVGNGESNKLTVIETTARFGNDRQRLPALKVKLDRDQWTIQHTGLLTDIDIQMLGGADKVTIKLGLDTSVNVSGGGGNDVIRLKGEAGGRVYGDGGKDKITGGTGPDTLYGGGGNDFLNGGRGDDILSGDGGADILKAGSDNDILLGGSGTDNLNGGSGRDLLIGGLGSDTLDGKGDDDILIGASTTHDDDETNLKSIIQKWTADTEVQDRIDDIRGSNDTDLGLFDTISDDTIFDKITSDPTDWAFVQDLDELFGSSDFLNAD